MPDYKKAKIYKIVSDSHPELVYYGSTCQTLSSRLVGHRVAHNRFVQGTRKHAITSSKLLALTDYKIILVEDCPCERKEQLIQKEAEYIRNNECVNKVIPGRTSAEWYEDNKESSLERQNKYDNEHKEQRKKYRDDNKISGRYPCLLCSIKFPNNRDKYKHCKTNRHLSKVEQTQCINLEKVLKEMMSVG